jgi:hypothetical protein
MRPRANTPSPPHSAGGDRLYAGTIEIDDDVRDEYWSEIRRLPDRKGQKLIRCAGQHY